MTQLKLKNKKPLWTPPARTGPSIKSMPEFILLDYETDPILSRPEYPPRPHAYAIKWPRDKKSRGRAWGLSDGNNCTKSEAQAELKEAWRSGLPIVAQHGKFDFEVSEKFFGLPLLPWERMHDTEYLLFLSDPHARSLALKESAERILKIPPDERNELKDWILANVKGATKKEWGAHICKAPGRLVIPYMNGDIFRTDKLFRHLLPEISERNMMDGYNRERRLMPILLRNEQEGIRVDTSALERDFTSRVELDGKKYMHYQAALECADNWIRKKLGVDDLNINTDKEMGEALFEADAITQWSWTKGGKNRAPQRQVGKKVLLIEHFRDRKLALMIAYRNRLTTCLNMFGLPWLERATVTGGTISTSWNQTRSSKGEKFIGTRTGRPSTDNFNFLNISKSFEDKGDGYEHPKFMTKLPPLPLMRRYLLPDKGGVWGHRDYNQQELRMLGHFENGRLQEDYSRRPYRNEDGSMRFDIHTTVQQGLFEIAMLKLPRTPVKVLNFSDIYGKGLAALAESLGLDIETTKLVRKAKNQLMPGVPALTERVKRDGGMRVPIITWGGREYYAEEPAFSKKFNRVMDFCYKLLNYLIQGSSADVTKEALIRYDEHPKREGRFLVTVYDEINSSMPKGRLNEEMKILRESMESVACRVPMLSDGKTGPTWGDIKGCWKQLPAERTEYTGEIKPWW